VRRLGNRPDFCDHLLPGGPVRMPGENDYSWARAQLQNRSWWRRLLGRLQELLPHARPS
jgi:hypothetical protein